MIIYYVLGAFFGALIIVIGRLIANKILKYLAIVIMFGFFGVIASSILYGDMVKRVNRLIQIRQEIGLNVSYERFSKERMSRWNGAIYSGELIGMVAAFLYFRKKDKNQVNKKDS